MWTVVELGYNQEEQRYYVLGYNSSLKLTHGFNITKEGEKHAYKLAPGITFPSLLQMRLTIRDTTPEKITNLTEANKLEIKIFTETESIFNRLTKYDNSYPIDEDVLEVITDEYFFVKHLAMIDCSTAGIETLHYLDYGYLKKDKKFIWAGEDGDMDFGSFKETDHKFAYQVMINGYPLLYTNIMNIVAKKQVNNLKKPKIPLH